MTLEDVRARIDAIDREVVGLLARRQALVLEAAAFKADAADVAAPDRRAAMMVRLEAWAEQEGLAPEVVRAVWTAMVDAFVALELEEHRRRTR
ncbi:chorismate mutase [Nocardioides solisilvae]|uniref:chorismate mutase n=1 Tax=Nocardioides solisilvae TaxID=1542435 RepID=UPI000D74800E|nr:chorismate mutase [Nocardioides solisilvae]